MTVNLNSQQTPPIPANDLAVQFATPATLEEFRENAFRRRVCDRINEARAAGRPPESAIPQIALEQKSLSTAILDPAFIALAGDELFKAKQAQGTATTAEHEREVMKEIFTRRAAEAEAFARKLTDPKFCEELLVMAPNLAPPGDVAAQLRGAKLQETIDDLLHREPDGTPAVQAHVDAYQIGMLSEHQALAAMFDPNGALHKPLMAGLAARMPAAPNDRIHTLTLEWLGDRHDAASVTLDLLKGEAYHQAIATAAEYHRPKAQVAVNDNEYAGTVAPAKVLLNGI